MFEQEILVLKTLANGINYFTGEKCKNDSILNDADIVRTLYNVCEILRDCNTKRAKPQRSSFSCPADLEERFEFGDEMNMSQILEQIQQLYPDMKKPKHKMMTEILKEQGVLENYVNKEGQTRTRASEKGKEYGVFNEMRSGMRGTYNVVIYNKAGQQYVLSLIKNL